MKGVIQQFLTYGAAVWDQLVLLKLLIREEGEHLVQHTIDRQYGSYLSLSLANIL